MSQQVGFDGEVRARAYLVAQGLVWVESNYRARCGEIDLIMREGRVLVFIEVRARSSKAFGGGAASVTYRKQQKVIRTALLYLQRNRLQDQCVVRFDVVSLDGVPPEITWIRDAFGC